MQIEILRYRKVAVPSIDMIGDNWLAATLFLGVTAGTRVLMCTHDLPGSNGPAAGGVIQGPGPRAGPRVESVELEFPAFGAQGTQGSLGLLWIVKNPRPVSNLPPQKNISLFLDGEVMTFSENRQPFHLNITQIPC